MSSDQLEINWNSIKKDKRLDSDGLLNYSHVGLGDAGIKKIADLLRSADGGGGGEDPSTGRKIEILWLETNEITDVGAGYLADALRSNSTLRSLVLRHNKITDVGAGYFADALCSNNTLQWLLLEDNSISSSVQEKVEALAQDVAGRDHQKACAAAMAHFYELDAEGEIRDEVNSPELSARLVERLTYFKNYMVRDRGSGLILRFDSAMVIGGQFYMTCVPHPDRNLGKEFSAMERFSYRRYGRDSKGRDTFKATTAEERESLTPTGHAFGDRSIAGGEWGFKTVIELDDVYYVVFELKSEAAPIFMPN